MEQTGRGTYDHEVCVAPVHAGCWPWCGPVHTGRAVATLYDDMAAEAGYWRDTCSTSSSMGWCLAVAAANNAGCMEEEDDDDVKEDCVEDGGLDNDVDEEQGGWNAWGRADSGDSLCRCCWRWCHRVTGLLCARGSAVAADVAAARLWCCAAITALRRWGGHSRMTGCADSVSCSRVWLQIAPGMKGSCMLAGWAGGRLQALMAMRECWSCPVVVLNSP